MWQILLKVYLMIINSIDKTLFQLKVASTPSLLHWSSNPLKTFRDENFPLLDGSILEENFSLVLQHDILLFKDPQNKPFLSNEPQFGDSESFFLSTSLTQNRTFAPE